MFSNYQILPPLQPNEFEALKASIAERGVNVPIIVDQEGNVIDGYHRQRACDELGIFCPREVRHFESETDKLELVLRINCGRRQLNRQQKRSVIDASDLAGWEKNENVPPGTATRLLGRLPEEIRRLVDNGESSAA